MQEILSCFLSGSLAYFNVKSLTFDLTFVNSKDRKPVINYPLNTYTLCNIKPRFF